MLKVGKYYKPSFMNFEDPNTVLQINAIRCGRVEYTNIKTKNYGSMPIDEFRAYYEETRVKGKKCEDCIEWEYFDGYGYGCYCMKTMTPIDADKCEFYADKRPDIPHSWKPSKTL